MLPRALWSARLLPAFSFLADRGRQGREDLGGRPRPHPERSPEALQCPCYLRTRGVAVPQGTLVASTCSKKDHTKRSLTLQLTQVKMAFEPHSQTRSLPSIWDPAPGPAWGHTLPNSCGSSGRLLRPRRPPEQNAAG